MSNTIKDAPTNTGNATSCCGPDCCSPASGADAAAADLRASKPSATSDIKDVAKEKGGPLPVESGSCCGMRF